MANSGVFVTLVDSKDVARVTLAFESMIQASLESHPVRHLTTAEVRRRFDILCKIFEQLRGDLKWGVQRALDNMPAYFGSELNGSPWTPDTRACWMPGDEDGTQ